MRFPRFVLAVLSSAAFVAAAAARSDEGSARTGVPIDAALRGPSSIEGMDVVLDRQRLFDASPREQRRAPSRWSVPSARSVMPIAVSGDKYIINKGGALAMGIGFGGVVDVHEVHVAGQAQQGVWPPAVRVVGYLDGVVTGRTAWLAPITGTPQRLPIELAGVDRIVVEARSAFRGRAWYGLDDLAFAPAGGERRVLTFEDTTLRQRLSGTGYAGLTWETAPPPAITPDALPAPSLPDEIVVDDVGAAAEPDPDGGVAGGVLPPLVRRDFQGVIRGDAGSTAFPPDSHGAIGPAHFVSAINRNLAIHDRIDGTELVNVYMEAFLPGSNGDPRVMYDHFDQRWYVIVSDFESSMFFAVSLTDDPTGDWFKTSFQANTKETLGCWPDYPTLGFDADGIYIAAWMAGGCGNTIFVIDKTPLLSGAPVLGSVVAFRELPSWQIAFQPAIPYGPHDGLYFVTAGVFTDIILRRFDGPVTEPTLVDLGSAFVAHFDQPPSVPALGSVTNLDHTIGKRALNAVYRDGSIWTCHDVVVNGKAGVNWYEIDVDTLSAVQSGTIADDELYYFYGSIAVNGNGDAVIGCSGANASQYAAAYVAGRRGTDPSSVMSEPLLLRAGNGAQNNVDASGRNRWGDYSMTVVDPLDDETFWTIQEYAHDTDIWGTHIAQLGFTEPALQFTYPDGRPGELDPRGDSFAVEINSTPGYALDIVSPRLHLEILDVWQDVPLVWTGGGSFDVVFPALPCPADVRYYISAATTSAEQLTSPEHAPVLHFDTAVADSMIFAEDDVESASGWIPGVPGDDATAGQWTFGDPIGTIAQPEDDHTPGAGTRCFFTGQGEPDGEPVDADVDGGRTTLVSPEIGVGQFDNAVVGYWRWYSNSAANQPGPADDGDPVTTPSEDVLVVEITGNGVDWVEVETVGPDVPLPGWTQHEVVVADLLPPTEMIQLRFIASDEGDDSLVEAAIDDLHVSVIVCGQDLDGDVNGDGVVDVDDLVAIILAWGPCDCPEDTNDDGSVDVDDLITVILSWTG